MSLKETMTDYKSYSLSQLSNWIHDSISSGDASPHEIYSTIRSAVQEEYNIHKDLADRSFGLLELLSGHRPVRFGTCDSSDTSTRFINNLSDFWFSDSTQKNNFDPEYGYEYAPLSVNKTDNIDNIKKWVLPVEIDAASGEYYLQLPEDLLDTLGWEEGNNLEYIPNDNGSFTIKKCD